METSRNEFHSHLRTLIRRPEADRRKRQPAMPRECGRKYKDIWPILRDKGAATEILHGRRAISKAQAKRLAEYLQVPIDLFI